MCKLQGTDVEHSGQSATALSCVLQVPTESDAPDYGELGAGGAHKGSSSAADALPKSWKGVGEWQARKQAISTGQHSADGRFRGARLARLPSAMHEE